MSENVSIIIPVYNGGKTLISCLDAIKNQEFTGEKDIIVIDSGSTDGSIDAAKRAGASVSCIENKEFHHSRTRNAALSLAKYEKIVYFVQDAVPVSNQWLSGLCKSLDLKDVASVSVRQIPHADADAYARFEVEFHSEYLSEKEHLKYLDSLIKFKDLSYDDALHKVRHDNVCSIYRRSLLVQHPFPDVEFGEDMAWAHEMLLSGYKILYEPKVAVFHSHNRPPEYRFKRSVVNSIACSKILGRVKDDISYLSVSDVIEIRDKLMHFSMDLKNNFAKQGGLRQLNVDTFQLYFLARKFIPYFRKIIRLFGQDISPSRNLCRHDYLQQAFRNNISFLASMISRRYAISSVKDYSSCVDQITATTIGRMYGELYSAYMLRGAVPNVIEDLVQPYLKGV